MTHLRIHPHPERDVGFGQTVWGMEMDEFMRPGNSRRYGLGCAPYCGRLRLCKAYVCSHKLCKV